MAREILYQTHANRRSTPVPVAQILRFESGDKYVTAHTDAGLQYLLTDRLQVLEAELAVDFVRLHRGHLVRASMIQRFWHDGGTQGWAELKDTGITLPVSRRHYGRLRRAFSGV